MPDLSRSYSSLYYRLLAARRILPLVASLGVIAFETVEHRLPFGAFDPAAAAEILIFALIGPGLMFMVLTWLLQRILERDRAERDLALVIAHEQQLLSTFERIVRTERPGFVPTLEHLLAAMGEGNSISSGAVYLLPDLDSGRLAPAAYWPTREAGALLDEVAHGIASSGVAALAECTRPREICAMGDGSRVVAAPVAGAGELVGLLVLSLPASVKLPESNILNIVTSMMALVIRNGQLYARLQSQAVLEERNELAREVHDTLAQSLGFLNLKAQHAQRLADRGLFGEASAALGELCAGSQQVYGEVRHMIHELRSSGVGSGGLVHSLREYTAVMAARTGLEITVDAQAEPELSPDARLQLFRVVQEALSNVHRHARACHVLIRLEEGPEGVLLSVEDDGSGLSSGRDGKSEGPEAVSATADLAGSGEHLGLRIMAERVQSIGGDIQMESRAGKGTILRIRVPANPAGALDREVLWSASAS